MHAHIHKAACYGHGRVHSAMQLALILGGEQVLVGPQQLLTGPHAQGDLWMDEFMQALVQSCRIGGPCSQWAVAAQTDRDPHRCCN